MRVWQFPLKAAMRKGPQFLFLLLTGSLGALLILSERKVEAEGSLTITLDTVVSGLSNPVFLTHAGDGSGRLFIVEQAGRVLIFQNGNLLTRPFLDIRSRVASGGETGFL